MSDADLRTDGEQPVTDREVAVAVASAAAGLARERRRAGVSVAATKTSDTDVVTEADRASERLISDLLRHYRPHDAVVGEEGAQLSGDSGVRWIVDPIDGTVNYLYGLDWYAVSVACERDGEMSAGAVVNAATGTVWSASAGEGATRDGEPIRVRDVVPMEQRLIFTGFNYEPDIRTRQAASVAMLLPRIRDIRRFGSCALDLCLLAEGGADGYVEEGVHEWDHAAGGLIAREAGARVETHTGASGRTAIVAAPEGGYEPFLGVVRACDFLDGDTPV